ncbi:MAG TPA: PAS domain S-box protein [Gemmatimonadaceae bacterium]|nr:PAS domain S-box protein [Gemmatimonadaceae bacterium]
MQPSPTATGFWRRLIEAVSRDRTARSEREWEQRFRSVADNVREALLITDATDAITFANARVRDVFGYEPQDLIGKKATELLLPEALGQFPDRMRRRLTGESETYETVLVRKDGTRIFAEVSATPYRDASGKVIGSIGAISDVSSRKRLEERLHQGMRMEAVGQLAGGVAHDFNNLLTVIKCHTELLLADMPANDPARDSVAEIEKSAMRAATLTQQLLAFGRRQFMLPRRLMLSDVVADSAPRLRTLLRESVRLVTKHDESTSEVFADPLHLEHALATLVRNANDAMPDGGRITIETRSLELSDMSMSSATHELPGGRYAQLLVSDTGIGMPQEVMARLFEPFVTTKRSGEGTGLGLASMYGIVRQSGGYVDIESAQGKGTTVRIYLPVSTTAEHPRFPRE